jgi:peptidoglycan hydrolase-like amidase
VRYLLLSLIGLAGCAQTVDIGVFSLFRAQELRVMPASGALLVDTGNTRMILEGRQSYVIRTSLPVRVSARDGSAADFRLSIPGKIERQFHGTLAVHAGDHKLIAVVAMDRELAVASVVAAEMTRATPIEALKAQAVIARSYYAATRARHDEFDFCDTTHCQFLREWPEPASAPFRAARETRDLLLEYSGKPVAALYSAACGGRTRSLDDAGGYAYRSVECDYCRRHSPGLVQGHQLGLCQAGASAMAASGANFRTILDHYYPGTSLTPIFLLPASLSLRHSKDE